MQYSQENGHIILKNVPCLSLDLTLDCGQAFRWEKNNGIWSAVVKDKYIEVSQSPDLKTLTFYNTSPEDFEKIWVKYFDLERDYDKYLEVLKQDTNIASAIDEFYGIRILRQDPWETICSFIISQNNNIPRIKGIIDRLCESFGSPIKAKDGQIRYSFPTPECLAGLTVEDLAPLRAGFRAKYILDAAKKISDGTVNIDKIFDLSLDKAEEELIKVKGIGKKVAQCSLLYGFNMLDAFPEDVWVKRIMSEMYPNGLPACTKNIRGIAQQYLFHWRRNSAIFN